MAIITISREFGSGGEAVADIIAKCIGFKLLNRETLEEYVQEHDIPEIRLEWLNEISPRDIEGFEKERVSYIETLKEIINDLARRENLVLLGRGGQFLFQDREDAVHVKIVANFETRAQNIQERFNVDKAAALRLINEKDAERYNYALYFHRGDWNDIELYDLTINTGRVSLEEASELVIYFLMKRKFASSLELEKCVENIKEISKDKIEEYISSDAELPPKEKKYDYHGEFANESEEEFARILDYYKIKYLYEPTTFPLKWDSEGNIEKAFTPDFYFPDFDLYIELTTMKQELVTKKNRKLKELKKMYPDVNVKLFYRKNYRKLLEKFGIKTDK